VAAVKAAGLRPRPPERRFAPRRHLSLAAARFIFAGLLVASLAVLVVLPPTPVPQSSSPATTAPPTPARLAVTGSDLMPPSLVAYAQTLGDYMTVDSYTVMLDRVYFDASILMVSYRIAGPHTRYLGAMGNLAYLSSNLSNNALMVDTQDSADTSSSSSRYGNMNTWLPSQGWQVANQVPDGALVQGIASFDPPAAITNSLALHLDLGLIRNPAIDINSVSPQLITNQTQYVAGQFAFDFTAPRVTAQQTISVGQQVTVGGVRVTLEQVILTPAGTQLVLRYDGKNFNPKIAWQPDLTTNPPGEQIGPHTAIEVSQRSDGAWVYSSHAALFDHPGLCTVTISALHGYDQANSSASETQITGPWTFQFTIPQN
jgi:hypothetical protein